jgi:hypothetical protein
VPEESARAVTANTPVDLARFVKEARPPAPIFNYMEWGGYLEWELYPQYRMFIDGRFEARQVHVWRDYLTVSRGRSDWPQTIDSYGINTLILSKDFHGDLIRIVSASGDWRKVYDDDLGAVFTRAR